VIPAAAWLALLLFRLAYFGDPFPDPYYAKAAQASALRLFNPLGGGWTYILDWLRSSGALVLLPLWAAAPWRESPPGIRIALALIAGQVAFIVMVGGDWMGSSRFLAPVLPLVALVSGWALSRMTFQNWRGSLAIWIGAGILSVSSVSELISFRLHPTTPYDTVARVGQSFVELAHRLGVEQPSLAHHDAGGTSYKAGIVVIDLFGIANRTIARHLSDPDFVADYLLKSVRPTFFFGSVVNPLFAPARTGFHRRPAFLDQYVRIDFVDQPILRGREILCHVRRDLVREAPGITILRDSSGAVERLVVRNPE
jgi:hypothetical protein